MSILIGAVIVLSCVLGGYLMGHGNLSVLIQPPEVVIIGGAAVGALVISMPMKHIKELIHTLLSVIKTPEPAKKQYIELLILLYQLFTKTRREGLISIEADLETPKDSEIFKTYGQLVLKNHHLLYFLCDNFRVITTTTLAAHELEALMDAEIEVIHHESLISAHAVNRLADGLPGLGIVAAVMGVVITMGHIDQPPKILGHHIGAALVGTFMGVLMCYGFCSPTSTYLEHRALADMSLYHVIKMALVTFVGAGNVPQTSVEFARRVVPADEKPSFFELEAAMKGKPKT